VFFLEKEEGETALARREANDATDCDLENNLRAFWDFCHMGVRARNGK
jgi:hypothetical protein